MHELTRTNPANFTVSVNTAHFSKFGSRVRLNISRGPNNEIETNLDAREVDDLIVMLEYYKLKLNLN